MTKYLFIALAFFANFVLGFAQFSSPVGNVSPDKPIVLRGTIITPGNVLKHGYVSIVNGRIASVSEEQPNVSDAIFVNTHGIILPGFVDVHNHVPFNVFPRWKPGRQFTNRNQWRTDAEVIRLVNGPMNRLESSYFCDMNNWGELRALVGGTTSIMTTQPRPCISGLVRNLDFNSRFYGTTELDREHIFNVLDLPPANNPAARAAFVGAANFFIANPFYEGLFIHLAEGTDDAAKEEITFVRSQSLLNPKGVIIHGIPLTEGDFHAMALNGTALVWSPRSNLELYGQTANILAAVDAGVEVALAPDWAITGSSNMLDELKTADAWNREQLGGRLTDRQLVDMATSIPARIAGVEDHVGAVSVGLRADLIVLNGDHNVPFRAVIDATATDVQLVFIDGVPLYGDRIFMEHFWSRSELEEIKLSGVTKTLATPAAAFLVNDIESRLSPALEAEGTSLAPLTEPTESGSTLGRANFPTPVSKEFSKSEPMTYQSNLAITAYPNPSHTHFTLKIKSSSAEVIQLRILDAMGRLVETKGGITANTSVQIGSNLQPGMYMVELMQRNKRQMFKLIRQ